MKPTPYDDMELTEWLIRFGPAVLAWTAVIGFFAIAGSLSDNAPAQMADAVPAVLTMDDEVAAVPTLVVSMTSTREPELRDAAIVAHKALDPVGAGQNSTP